MYQERRPARFARGRSKLEKWIIFYPPVFKKGKKRSDADNGLCGARWRRVAPLSRATQRHRKPQGNPRRYRVVHYAKKLCKGILIDPNALRLLSCAHFAQQKCCTRLKKDNILSDRGGNMDDITIVSALLVFIASVYILYDAYKDKRKNKGKHPH